MTHANSPNSPLNQQDALGRTPLVTAIMASDEKFITMLRTGADPNRYSTVSFHGQFDMEWAVRQQACQNLNLIAITPLHAALIRGRADFIEAALSSGGNPDLPALGANSPPNENDGFFWFINHFKRKYGGMDSLIKIEPLDSNQEWLEQIFRSYCHNPQLPFTHNINDWISFATRLCEYPSLADSYPAHITHITSPAIIQALTIKPPTP
jgi:hypothetical protein